MTIQSEIWEAAFLGLKQHRAEQAQAARIRRKIAPFRPRRQRNGLWVAIDPNTTMLEFGPCDLDTMEKWARSRKAAST